MTNQGGVVWTRVRFCTGVAWRLATVTYVAMVKPILYDNSYSPNIKYESYWLYGWLNKKSSNYGTQVLSSMVSAYYLKFTVIWICCSNSLFSSIYVSKKYTLNSNAVDKSCTWHFMYDTLPHLTRSFINSSLEFLLQQDCFIIWNWSGVTAQAEIKTSKMHSKTKVRKVKCILR